MKSAAETPTASETGLSGWGKRQLAKRRQIIEAAATLFLEKGAYTDVSMDAIVAKSAVSKRTLYNYYQSKEQLFLDVIVAQLESVWPVIEIHDNPKGLVEKLKEVAYEALSLGMKPIPLAMFRMMVAEAQRFPDLSAKLYAVSFERVVSALADLIKRDGAKADLAPKDPTDAARHFMDLLIGTTYLRVVMGIDPPMTPKQIKAHAEISVHRFLAAERS